MIQHETINAETLGQITATPEYALVLSGISGGIPSGGLSNPAILGLHRIYNRNGESRLGAGEMVSPESLSRITADLEGRASRIPAPEFIESDVLATTHNYVAWHVPGGQRPMFFNTRDYGRFALDKVAWPSLMFVASNKGLFVAALASNERPQPDTPLYHAPVMNVGDEGNVCLGSASRPSAINIGSRRAFEQAFFESNFSHGMGHNKLRYRHLKTLDQKFENETLITFYRNLAKRGCRQFPVRHLLATETTVSQFIERTANDE